MLDIRPCKLRKAKADYVFTLKNNHKTLYEDIKLWLDTEFDNNHLTVLKTTDKDHGRFEIRHYTISTHLDWLPNKDQWANLNAVIMVESTRKLKNTITTERRYYLTSLTDLTTIAHAIRHRWAIENSQHWVLDVIFGEDGQKRLERNEKANKALLTRIGLNLIRANGDDKLSVKRSKMRASQNKDYLEQLLFGKVL